jgi:hypothetical protein
MLAINSRFLSVLILSLIALQSRFIQAAGWQRFVVPTVRESRQHQSLQSEDDMIYHPGSPVLTGDVNVYNIYYGNVFPSFLPI